MSAGGDKDRRFTFQKLIGMGEGGDGSGRHDCFIPDDAGRWRCGAFSVSEGGCGALCLLECD